MNNKKIVIICLIITAFFLYLVASQLSEALFNGFDIPVNNDFVLTVPQYIGIAIAGLALLIVLKNAVAMGFFSEVVVEMSKVVYPTPKESALSAGVVIVMVGIATVLLVVYDWVWALVTAGVLSISI
jgi:preprotein translocase SecE subunit